MQVTRTSCISGITRTIDLPITAAQLSAWAAGALIQDAMPDLTPDQREFLMTGAIDGEWEAFWEEEDYE